VKEVNALSEHRADSIGVAVDTENEANVPFYKHHGYKVIKRTTLEEMSIWSMFRKDEERGEG
jgi:hypothetical protein